MKRNPFVLRFLEITKHYAFATFVLTTGFAYVAFGQQKAGIENKVPKHLPIKVEILYGKRAETLENARIKVTNTGPRPIYSLHLGVSTADELESGMKHGVSRLYFGRTELRTFGNLANSDDPSLLPTESMVFELNRELIEGFKKLRRDSQRLVPERYELFFQFLGFGDDSGFSGTNGKPFSFKNEPSFEKVADRPSFF